ASDFVMPAAVGDALAGLAAVAAAGDDLDRAARLIGAASAQHHDGHGDPVERRVDATFFEPARARWGADAWNAAASEGAAMSVDEATAYALAEPRAASSRRCQCSASPRDGP